MSFNQYTPPAGYKLDAASGLYYTETQSHDPKTGQLVRLVTWFDPTTGLSQQASYPMEPTVPQPTPISAVKPAPPPPASTLTLHPPSMAAAAGTAQAPNGFTEDSATGRFYQAAFVNNSWQLVWYDPQTGQYTQDTFALMSPAPAAQGKRPAGRAARSRALPIFLVLLLIGGVGTGIWYFKPFPFQNEAALAGGISDSLASSNSAKPPSGKAEASSSQPASSASDAAPSSQPAKSSAPTASKGTLKFGTPMNKIFPENWKEASFEELQSILQKSVDKGDFDAMDMDSLPGFFVPLDTPADAEPPEDLLDSYLLFASEVDENGQPYSPERRPTLAIYANMIFFLLVPDGDHMSVLIGEYTPTGSFEDKTTMVILTPIDDSLQKLTGWEVNDILFSLSDHGFLLDSPPLGDCVRGEEFVTQ